MIHPFRWKPCCRFLLLFLVVGAYTLSTPFYPTAVSALQIIAQPKSRFSTEISSTTAPLPPNKVASDSPTDSARFFLKDFEQAWNTASANDLVQNYFVASPQKTEDDDDDEDDEAISPFWRDMVAFTWNIVTHEGAPAVERALEATAGHRPTTHWTLATQPLALQVNPQGGLDFWCDLELQNVGTGKAHVRLTKDNKIQTLLTTLMELTDRPFQIRHNRIRGHVCGAIPNRKYWQEQLEACRQRDDFVIIIGGGQAGLALGARLHLMDIPYTILEAGSQPGMAWRKRYPSLYLHDPVWYNHMPYLPFPETWPILAPRDKIADWLEFYAKALDLKVKTKTRVTRVTQADNGMWQVKVRRAVVSADGLEETIATETLHAKHVVFATGNSSKPRIPNIPGFFWGRRLHSSEYHGGRSFANLRVLVIGANNSGFDIAQDLWEQGAKRVTMVQRTPSMVVSTDSVLKHGLGPLYRQGAPLHHEDADLVATMTPFKLLLPRWKAVNQLMQLTDKELHDGLTKAGYELDQGPGGTGVFAKSATEGGGFYIDMGCAELVTRGDVKVRYATVTRFKDNEVVIFDKISRQEESLRADVVVYATGFDTMDQWVAELCGKGVAQRIGRTWGIGLGKRSKDPGPWEGELRNMWKPTTVEGLWFHGGNLAQSRHYSRFLALQLAARFMGINTPVYGTPKPTRPGKYED